MKKAFVFFVLAMALLVSCSTKNSVVGTWTDIEGYTWTFSANGKLTYNASSPHEYQYSVTDTKLMIFDVDYSVIIAMSYADQTYNISFSPDGKTLMLTGGRNLNGWSVAGPGWSQNKLTKGAKSGGGGKSPDSLEKIKEYLNKKPANSPDKPIKVSISANDVTIENIAAILTSSGKYVSLKLTGSSLTAIPAFAFYDFKTNEGCANLVSIAIPNSVTSIEGGAINKCTSLKSVTIPNSVTTIEVGAFAGCTSLKSVTIGNSVTSIGDIAFAACDSLASVTIPNSVTSIGMQAFNGCKSLASVTFQGTIASGNFSSNDPFPGDLRAKYLAGGRGTYTTRNPGENAVWTKQ